LKQRAKSAWGTVKTPNPGHSVKGGIALIARALGGNRLKPIAQGPQRLSGRQQRRFLAPLVVGSEEIRLVLAGGYQVEQDDVDSLAFTAAPVSGFARDALAESRYRASRFLRSHLRRSRPIS
jgi:hypothetical protein